MSYRVCVVGSGNLAFCISPHIQNSADFNIDYVISRNSETGFQLAQNLEAKTALGVKQIDTPIDIFLLWVHDDVLDKLSKEISVNFPGAIIVHSSGIKKFKDLNGAKLACIWPIQSISKKDADLDIKSTPLFVIKGDFSASSLIDQLASVISENIYYGNESQKEILHLSAVMSNNFINHLMFAVESILEDNQLPAKILKSLINNTFHKIQTMAPLDAQTGPAIRKDFETLKRHIHLLEDYPEFQEVYKSISKSIIKTMMK